MTREQILSDTARALRECFPEKADAILREIEARFADPPAPLRDAESVDILLSGSGPYAWPDRTGWGLAFEFMRAMQRLSDAGFAGDVRVTLHATRT